MPESVRTFLESVSEAFRLESPVYEFGYGPTVDWFTAAAPESDLPEDDASCLDDSEPPQIGRLEDLVELPFPDGAARAVIAAGALEHVFEPRKAVEEMVRVLAPGGILVVCCSRSGGSSPLPAERYWHPTPQALQRLMAGLETTLVGWQGGDDAPHTLFGVGSKSPATDSFLAGVNHFLDSFGRRLRYQGAQTVWWRRLGHGLLGWTRPTASPHAASSRRTSAWRNCAGGWRSVLLPTRRFYTAQFVLHLPASERLKHRLLAGCLPGDNPGSRLGMSH